jgi:hypothetical protein
MDDAAARLEYLTARDQSVTDCRRQERNPVFCGYGRLAKGQQGCRSRAGCIVRHRVNGAAVHGATVLEMIGTNRQNKFDYAGLDVAEPGAKRHHERLGAKDFQ